MRVFRKIILAVSVLLAAGIVAAIILGKLFEEELARFAVGELNRQIRSEVRIEDVQLSFLKKFPDATLELRDVYLSSVPDFPNAGFKLQHGDTLMAAERVFMRFDLLKVLRHQYLLREVQVQSGKLNLLIDPAGTGNFTFWKKSLQTDSEKNFLVELEDVKVTDLIVNYENLALQIQLSGTIRKSYFEGKFSSEDFLLSAGADGMLHRYINRETVFLSEQKISSSASMFIDPRAVQISEAELIVGGQQILVTGSILRPKPLEFDLDLEGRHLNLEDLLRHFTLTGGVVPENIKAGGDLDLKGSVTGIVSSIKMPQITASFNLKDGWLQISRVPRQIQDIQLTGNYSNGNRRSPETTLIELKDVSMRYGDSRIGGDYSMRNWIRPDFNYRIKTDLNLTEIQDLMSEKLPFNEMQGRLLSEIRIRGGMNLLKVPDRKDLIQFDYQADLRLEHVSLALKSLPFHFRDFSGEAVYSDHLDIINLMGICEDSEVSVSGRMDNLLEFLLTQDANLWMDMDLYSERINLSHPAWLKTGAADQNKNDTINLPDRLYLKTRFWLDNLEAGTFAARQITGNLIYKPKRLTVNQVEGLSMDGRIESAGIFEQQKNHNFLVNSTTILSSVDITKAFQSFRNFGQSFIVDRQIKGSLSGNVSFSAGLDTRLKIQKETVLSDCDVNIQNGELTGFEPMMKLSRFIDVEELGNVKFSTLTNEIFIRNQEVVIPGMDIHSSAFDIAASGLHGFDGNYSYKVKVALSELLARKSRKPAGKDLEFGAIQEDGLGRVYVYLIIEGTPQETQVRYDRRGAVQNVREQLKEEKLELKKILNEEFGIFQKDTVQFEYGQEKDNPAFLIRWEEDSMPGPVVKKDNNSGKEKFIIEWDDDETMEMDSIPENKRKSTKRK